METKAFPSGENRCASCEKPLFGRSDKKFCDDYCRNTFNNRLRRAENNYVRRVNHALLKNRKILESLLPGASNRIKVHEELLIGLGFQFNYHTHSRLNKKGLRYLFCYEYGYTPTTRNQYLLIRKNEGTIPD